MCQSTMILTYSLANLAETVQRCCCWHGTDDLDFWFGKFPLKKPRNWQVKQRWARLTLGWVTGCELSDFVTHATDNKKKCDCNIGSRICADKQSAIKRRKWTRGNQRLMFCRFKILIVEKRLVHLVKFACHNNFAIIFVKFRNFCRIVASIDKRNMSRIYIILQILWMILCHFFVWFLGSRSFLYLISRRLISRIHTNLKTFQRTVFAQDIVSFQISLEKK